MTLSEYLRVFKVFSIDMLLGEILAIIKAWQFPIKQSFKT